MRINELLFENVRKLPWTKSPRIGWWLDNDPVIFYHGTHKSRLDNIIEDGIYAPKTGPTAGWVSLALEPNTAYGYASMTGGESAFRAAGAKAEHVKGEDRIVIVLEIPQDYFLTRMTAARGQMDEQRNKLTDKELYEKWKESGKTDQEYYQLTEIRLPEHIPAKFIKGYMTKS